MAKGRLPNQPNANYSLAARMSHNKQRLKDISCACESNSLLCDHAVIMEPVFMDTAAVFC